MGMVSRGVPSTANRTDEDILGLMASLRRVAEAVTTVALADKGEGLEPLNLTPSAEHKNR